MHLRQGELFDRNTGFGGLHGRCLWNCLRGMLVVCWFLEVRIGIFSGYWFGRVSVLTFDEFSAFYHIGDGGGFEDVEFVLYMYFEAGNEALEYGVIGKCINTVAKVFKGGLVIVDSGKLLEFEQGGLWVKKCRWSKALLDRFCQCYPSRDLIVAMHPLKPCESLAMHVETC